VTTTDLAAPVATDDAPAGAPAPWVETMNDERIVLMGLLIETHDRLTRVLSAELEGAVGIPLTWFSVLLHLARSTDSRMTMSQLGAQVSLTSGGITRLVDRMSEEGLVERQSCASDRRSIYVALTPEGEAMLGRAAEENLQSLDRHLAALDDDDRTALTGALRKLHGNRPICGA
jgi:DNA-binding MarR family transcriptional regulator